MSDHRQKRFVPIDMWINMIGVDNFDFEVLEEGEFTKEELDSKERSYIDQYDSRNPKRGYNKQEGGFNNSVGEGNGRAKLTYADVVEIRKAYANHIPCKACYERYADRITYNSFQGVWQGRSWSNVMPEVFTKENKEWYTSGKDKLRATLTPEEVLKYRKLYVNLTGPEVYELLVKNKGPDFMKYNTFYKILLGDTRNNSIYQTVPIYRKKKKYWELNGEPVQTILESEK